MGQVSDGEQGELQPATSHEWVRVVSGIDFSTALVVQKMPPKKRPAGRTVKLVAFRLAWWADADGTQVKPSVARISTICELDYTTVKTCLRVLRETGLLDLISRGGGRGSRGTDANAYRLTIPTDLLERVEHRSPADILNLMRSAIPPSCRRPSTEGMPTPAQAVSVDNQAESTEGMTPSDDGAQRGCPPEHGGDAPPIPTSDLPGEKNTNQESPQVTTSPAPVDDEEFKIASDVLGRLPDFGTAIQANAPADLDLRGRIIWAAQQAKGATR